MPAPASPKAYDEALQISILAGYIDRVARRVARKGLVRLLAALAQFIDPGGDRRSPVAGDPPDRWLSRMVQRGAITAGDLRDPWGGGFILRRSSSSRRALSLSVLAG